MIKNGKNCLPRLSGLALFGAFTAHPASVDETYLEHARFAFRFSGVLFLASGAALLHAFFPFLCARTASQRVCGLADELRARLRADGT